MKKSDRSDMVIKNPREDSGTEDTPAFALPGVPLGKARPAQAKRAAPAPQPEEAKADAAAPAEAAPAEAAPAEASADSGDLTYHLSAARKYSAGRKYRSAAAEYGAAMKFLPAGDHRAVNLLERQGAMQLKMGNQPKAKEFFMSAIDKAKEFNTFGNDLSNSYLGLGYCQEKENKVQEAIVSYEKAREYSTSKKTKNKLAKTIADLKKSEK